MSSVRCGSEALQSKQTWQSCFLLHPLHWCLFYLLFHQHLKSYYLHMTKKAQEVHIFWVRNFKPNLHAPLRLSEVWWVLHFYQMRLTGLFCEIRILFIICKFKDRFLNSYTCWVVVCSRIYLAVNSATLEVWCLQRRDAGQAFSALYTHSFLYVSKWDSGCFSFTVVVRMAFYFAPCLMKAHIRTG